MTIIYSEERKKHHEISVDDVTNFGMEKACILGNIHLFSTCPRPELYKGFPYIEKDLFYEYLDDLTNKGHLEEF